MPNFSKGHNSGKIKWFFKKNNQVIYSSSPISWPSFKPLTQIVFEISCWQDFILIFSKGHNSRKGDNSKKKRYGSAIFPWGIHIWNFKTLARTVRKIWHDLISFGFFQRGITPEREITRTRKKNVLYYFSMRNPYMKFQNPSMHGFWRTDGRTDARTHARTDNPKPICSRSFFEVGGIINTTVGHSWYDAFFNHFLYKILNALVYVNKIDFFYY